MHHLKLTSPKENNLDWPQNSETYWVNLILTLNQLVEVQGL